MPRSGAIVALAAALGLAAIAGPSWALLPLAFMIAVNGQNWKDQGD